jgi:predicted aspartyl protease
VSVSFNPVSGLAIIRADIQGPAGRAVVRAAVDTGSTYTTVDSDILESVGAIPAPGAGVLRMRTANGISFAQRVSLIRFAALGKEVLDYPVISITIQTDLQIDALIGLDFLRNHKLTIDFNHGTIELN